MYHNYKVFAILDIFHDSTLLDSIEVEVEDRDEERLLDFVTPDVGLSCASLGPSVVPPSFDELMKFKELCALDSTALLSTTVD